MPQEIKRAVGERMNS